MAESDLKKQPHTLPRQPASLLGHIDASMASHPWYPRIAPFMVYIGMLLVIDLGRGYALWTYPLLYVLQCTIVIALLWRYRRHLPEMTFRFHWLAVPVGVLVLVAWIGLGQWMEAAFPAWFAADEVHYFERMREQSAALYWPSISLRLLGMSLVVPVFEELCMRSLMLRGLHSARRTWVGLLQVAQDLPVVGDLILETRAAKHAAQQPPQFRAQFEDLPLGVLTVFGVAASTFVFMIGHVPRDWPGTIVCGVAYCLLLAATRRHGLGPVIWAHGITNALLWGWTLYTDDWRFL